MIPMTILGTRAIQFWLQMTSKFQHIHEERLVVDEIGLLGNLGGLLGLFVGFSLFGYIVQLIDIIMKRIQIKSF